MEPHPDRAANRVVLCVGSNTPGCIGTVDSVAERLCLMMHPHGEVLRSEVYTGPSHSGIGADYANCVVEGSLTMTLADLAALCRRMEREAGRTPQSKEQGIMPLDVDIVVWNGEVLRAFDYGSDHFRRGFTTLRVWCRREASAPVRVP